MGARPVALLDPLMFGPLDDERNRWLLEGVVAGIGGYGNCIGVPTVGGEVRFAEPHSANPTVNVMCVGIARADRLMTAASHTPQPGSLMVLYGSTTGRDGIGGVSVLASATLEEGSEESRPSVQIGDPFAEKLLIEASLELVEEDLLEGLQDLGGAGLTCAVSESAARAGLGARLDLDQVPLREPGMEAFEILTSESQERMLAIVHPSKLERVRAVCAKWGLATAVVATLEAGGDLDVRMAGDRWPRCRRSRSPRRRRSTNDRCGRSRPITTTRRSRRSTAISARRSSPSSHRPTWRPSDGSSSSTTGWSRARPSRGRDPMPPWCACRGR